MLSKIILFCLLAAATCQNDGDLESIIGQIFGTPPPAATTLPTIENKSPGPSTLVPGVVRPKPNEPQDLTCTNTEGQAGECVAYYLCNNNTINNDGEGVIDIRFRDGPCLSYLDTCCQLKDKSETPVTPKPEPKRDGCGWRNPNGVGIRTTGDVDGETKFAEIPWMCAILKIEPVNDNEPDGQKLNVYVGGGSLIHPSVVLTAAHYVAKIPLLRVRAGEWDTQSIKEPNPYQDRDVASIDIHQDFNKGNLFYDVAVLFLAQPMDLAPNVGVACLPPPRQRTPGGTRCIATGWGKDKFDKEGRYQVILKKIEVPVVDRGQCQNALRKTRLGRFFELHSSFMCAGGEPGRDTCRGDGGSPLSCPIETEDNRYMQSGIVAWGIGCGEDGTPGVYVDVSNLRNWIDDKVAGKGYDPKTYTY